MQIGKFEVLDTLGSGASSTIFKVRRLADNRIYAMKVVTIRGKEDMKYVDQAELEFMVASQLDHPHLEKIYAFEKIKGFFRVKGSRTLLEFVDGMSLANCKQLPMYRLVRGMYHAAGALAYMHSRLFYHADLKPENIMMASDGKVKIIDFGLVWREGEKKDRVQGTLDYLAPEQARKKIVNAQTDIFNYGATLYKLLVDGVIPAEFRTGEAKSIAKPDTLIKSLVERRREIPLELDELVRHCIRYKPADRPRSMEEVVTRMHSITHKMKADTKSKS